MSSSNADAPWSATGAGLSELGERVWLSVTNTTTGARKTFVKEIGVDEDWREPTDDDYLDDEDER